MPTARRTIRHADHGPNRHKARVGRQRAIQHQRAHDALDEIRSLIQLRWRQPLTGTALAVGGWAVELGSSS